jgi:hypothetical protein
MKNIKTGLIIVLLSLITGSVLARDRIRLETTVIKGNREMPQIVYIVPWKDMKNQGQKEQTLVLHSLFGDTFNPVHAGDLGHATDNQISVSDSRK